MASVANTQAAPRAASRVAPVHDGEGGAVRSALRAEGALALAASAYAYHLAGLGWGTFALLFLLPDVSMLGYLANRRFGAVCYNIGHSYLTPAAAGTVMLAAGWTAWAPLVLIWFAHIGFDRLMGYGLKYPQAFGATHLGWRGKPASAASIQGSAREVQA